MVVNDGSIVRMPTKLWALPTRENCFRSGGAPGGKPVPPSGALPVSERRFAGVHAFFDSGDRVHGHGYPMRKHTSPSMHANDRCLNRIQYLPGQVPI